MKFMRNGSRGLAVVAVFIAGALLVSCTGDGSDNGGPGMEVQGETPDDEGTPVDGGTMSYAIDREPPAWDIHTSAEDMIAALQRNVFDSLVFQERDGEFTPWLAKSWEISEDGLEYTFELRDDVTFTDGSEFNAESVKANFDHIVDPETKSQYASNLFGPVTETEVLGDYEVRVGFSEPFAPFLQSVSTPYFGFYSPAALEKTDDLDNVMSAIGTGPFKVENYLKGQELEYVKNPDYNWAPETAKHQGPPHLDNLVIRFITEDSARVGALSSAQVNVAGSLPPSIAESLKANPDVALEQNDAPGMPYTLFLNTSRAPLNDLKVRQAMQKAVPLDEIVKTIYFDQYKRAWGPLTPSTIAYDPSVEGVGEFNIDEANKLLDEAGWTEKNSDGIRTKDGEELTVHWPVSQTQREQRDIVAQSMASAMKDVGINLAVKTQDIGTYLDQLFAGDFDVMDWSFVRSDGDILRLHLDSAMIPVQNASHVDDPEMDALLDQTLATTDLEERNGLFGEVQMKVVDEALMLPIYVPGFIWGKTLDTHGITIDSNGWPLFYDAWLKP